MATGTGPLLRARPRARFDVDIPGIVRGTIRGAALVGLRVTTSGSLAEASVTKGGFFHHFPSKQALGLALVDPQLVERFVLGLFDCLRRHLDPFHAYSSFLREFLADVPFPVEDAAPIVRALPAEHPVIVVGDGDGMVGVGYGKAKEVPAAIAKGVEEAKKSFFKVPRIQGTIPHPVQGEKAAGVVLLRPAAPGTGVIAGGPVRAVLECAGIHDVLSKSLGSSNQINIVHATVEALRSLEEPEAVAKRRGLRVEDVAPAALLRARAEVSQ